MKRFQNYLSLIAATFDMNIVGLFSAIFTPENSFFTYPDAKHATFEFVRPGQLKLISYNYPS